MKISEKIVVGLDKKDLKEIVASYLNCLGYSCVPEDVCFQVGVGYEPGKGNVAIFEGCEVVVCKDKGRSTGSKKVNGNGSDIDERYEYLSGFMSC